jgi:serine/threonine protein kinase/WD40 repeat protein
MHPPRPVDFAGLPPTQAWRVDAVCRRFEAKWRDGHDPRVDDFLAEADPPERAALLRELLALELELRRGHGERPSLSDYVARYPALADQVRALIPLMVDMELPKSVAAVTATPSYMPAATTANNIPQQLGDYRILGRLGEGGMGVVYEAIQEGLGRHVALKIMRPEFLADPNFLQRFRREARAAAQLHHPHIVPVFDAGAHDGIPFFAMQYIAGKSLATILGELRRLRKDRDDGRDSPEMKEIDARTPPDPAATNMAEQLGTGRLILGTHVVAAGEPTGAAPLEQNESSPRRDRFDPRTAALNDKSQGEYFRAIARLGVQVAEALAFAHKRAILHRDIKPSNLLIGLDGHVWVSDFGLAKVVEVDDTSQSHDLAGTPRFMAPERFDGWSDRRSDVYALGVTLYEMATLQPAFPARDRAQLIRQILHNDPTPLRRLDRRVPRDLEMIIAKAMAREPAERYRSADELAEDLQNFLSHRPIRARRNSLHERAWKWCRRKPAMAGLWLALALGLAGTTWQWRRAEQSLGSSNRMAMGLALDRALALCEQGEPARGMLQMVELLRSAPVTAPEYEHAIRANLAAWARRVPRPVAVCRTKAEIQIPAPAQLLTPSRGEIVLLCTRQGILAWDLGSARATELAGTPAPGARMLSLRGDGRVVVAAILDGTVRSWDTVTGTPLGSPRRCPQVDRHDVGSRQITLLSPDGTMAATLVSDDIVQLWWTDNGRPAGAALQLESKMLSAAFRPDGKALAIFGARMYELWDTVTGARLVARPLEHDSTTQICSLAFRPDGRLIATCSGPEGHASGPRDTHLWDAATGRPIATPLMHVRDVAGVCWSADGKILATVDISGANRFWDSETGAPLTEPFWMRAGGENAFGWLRDTYISTYRVSSYGMTQWELPPPRPRGDVAVGVTLESPPPVATSPDGRLAVARSHDGVVRVREVASLVVTGPEMRHRDAVLSACFGPDGRTLVTGSADATAQIWDARTGRSIGSSLAHRGPVGAVAFRGDGRVVATGSDDGTARLWDAATGRPVGPSLPHPGPVVAVSFDRDGRSLLTRASDEIVRRWAIPRAVRGDSKRVATWLHALTGAELTPEGVIRKCSETAWDVIMAAREQGVSLEP